MAGRRLKPTPLELLRDRDAHEVWPRIMRAETAAAYVDEKSVPAFRRAVGKLWSKPIKLAGKGERWLRDDLDRAIDLNAGRGLAHPRDIADEL